MGVSDLIKMFGKHHGGHNRSHHNGYQQYDPHVQGCSNSGGVYETAQYTGKLIDGQRSCGKCGSVMQVVSRFCPSCGTQIEPAICKSCKNILPQNAFFCPSCGMKV